MATKNPVLQFTESHCAMLGKSIDELTADALKSLYGHVYNIWKTYKPALGEELGVKLYGNIWAELARISFTGAMAKLAQEIGKVTSAREFADIVAYCQRRRYIAFASEDAGDGAVKLKSPANPFVQVADMFGAPPAYKSTLVEMDRGFLHGLIADLKLTGRAEDSIVSHIAEGAAQTEISLALH